MSDMARKARSEMKSKAHRLADQSNPRKVDSSNWSPAPDMDTEKKTGERPKSRSAFKSGGLVHGEAAKHHAGHRPRRATGGPMGLPAPVAAMAPMVNDPRMLAAAQMGKASQVAGVPTQLLNEGGNQQGLMSRIAGVPHKRGGAAKKNWIAGATKNKGALHRELGVPEGKKIPAKKLAKAEHSDNPTERKRANLAKTLAGFHKKKGGAVENDHDADDRIERKKGGAAKGKTNINIIITKGDDNKQPQPGMVPPNMGPVHPPMPVGPMPPPGGGGMPAPPPSAMGGGQMGPPPMNQPMPRKDGGVVKMEAGAGGGEGRLEKARKYGTKPQG